MKNKLMSILTNAKTFSKLTFLGKKHKKNV